MGKRSLIRAALLALLSTAGVAASIPVTVRVIGDPIQSVDYSGEIGVVQLTPATDGKQFSGTVEVDSDQPVVHSLIVSYPDFKYPVNLSLHRYIKRVEFPLELKPAASCTVKRVESVEGDVTTLPEAISNSLLATRIASIKGNDQCDQDLRKRAVRAKFRNARRMSQLSKGLFVVPDALLAEVRGLSAHNAQALAEIDRYQLEESIELRGIQLVAARNELQQDRQFAEAFAVQSSIAATANADSKTRSVFANIGLTTARIEKDSAYLETLAEPQASAER